MNIVTSGVVTLNMNNQGVFPYLITLIWQENVLCILRNFVVCVSEGKFLIKLF